MDTLTEVLSRLTLPSNNDQCTFQLSSSNVIPSQTFPNPKCSLNAITLRSGTTLEERSPKNSSEKEATHEEDIVELEKVEEEEAKKVVDEEKDQARARDSKKKDVLQDPIPIPFSTLTKKTKKHMELDPKMVDIFKKVEVTIPLFDAIHQVLKYAKFLKDLCINKEKINDLETIPFGSSISALMGAIPEKCGDPGPCLFSCTIRGNQFIDCKCDLGACVSIMPLSVYDELNLLPLKQSAAHFVLADKSIIFVVSIVDDDLVTIKGLIFLVDFYVLEMPPNDSRRPSSILLGRPFLEISRLKLDAFLGTYSFEIDGRAVRFNLDEAMKHSSEDHSIFQCDIIDEVMAEVHNEAFDEMNLGKGTSVREPNDYNEDTLPPPMLSDNDVPSHELNEMLKHLPVHLKYASLDDSQKHPVIIARCSTPNKKRDCLKC
ncbi:uncharacterized protein LOC107607307 [Arachis ipaensis]|uniref:uncharacterized protein LOC107607307 n=1 Tax=Arachis ipaensis TaxID=130454 RepID=UPI0007AFC0E8|nr:uncharacterized protein LOC107607307 [Arachis ipaensis]XP_025664815.1 uncharacterized protein LOC112763331 [Arachis hypogaea]